jgi:hypothetical protein
MQLHVLTSPQRRMLLEMLASERSGEDALFVGTHFGREDIADDLCVNELAAWISPDELVFTDLGHHVAETLARRLVVPDPRFDLSC